LLAWQIEGPIIRAAAILAGRVLAMPSARIFSLVYFPEEHRQALLTRTFLWRRRGSVI
jgi:hypothetical protein